MQETKYLLIGSPNVGKSTYYNRITWKHAPVSNIDRATTFASSSRLRKEKSIIVTDLPGVNTLNPHGDDEKETFNYLFNSDYYGVINIVNANTLERDLLLTYQLAEAGVLSELLINMIDEISFDINKLSITTAFKAIVECISAKKNLNIQTSLLPIINKSSKPKTVNFKYEDKIKKFIESVYEYIPDHKLSKNFIAIQYLLDNQFVIDFLKQNKCLKKIEVIKNNLNITEQDILTIYKTRETFVKDLLIKSKKEHPKKNINKSFSEEKKFSRCMDLIFLNKLIAIPLFTLVMVGIYFITFYEYAGGWLQAQFNEQVLQRIIDLIKVEVTNINPQNDLQNWWAGFTSDGLLGGAFTIISFLPWLIILVFLISILEQIGLLSRMSIVFDRTFSKAGISGRALINLITGLGCNIPAITMTRNCNSIKERVVTSMLSPFVSCSARIIVYGFILEAVVGSELSWLATLGISLFSIIVAFMIGYFFSNLCFRKRNSIFITEISKFRSPDINVVLKKVFFECINFIKRTIIIIAICNLVIWFLLYTSPTSDFIINPTNETGINDSFLRYLSYPFQYILYPTGLGLDWRFAVSLVTAFPAKEIAASNIMILFNGSQGFIDAIQVLPVALSISYLMFFAFYIPCLATVVVMVKEIGIKYTAINIGIGLLFSFLFATSIFGVVGTIESIILENSTIAMNVILYITMFCILISLIILFTKNFYKNKVTFWDFKYKDPKYILVYGNYAIIGCLMVSLSTMLLVNL